MIAYAVGILIDENRNHNYFIGGLLPYMGWKTLPTSDKQYVFRAFWVAWFWKGVAFNGEFRPKEDT